MDSTEEHHEPTLPPEVVAHAVGFWDAQKRTIEGLAEEVSHEYTSKDRLRRIALMALAQLMAMTTAAAAEEAREAQPPAEESRIITFKP